MEERVAQDMMPTSKTGRIESGFTLIELTVVLVIIGLISLMIIPSLGRFYAGLNFRETTRRLISSINYTRSQAINSKSIHRLNFNQDGYWISHQEDPVESPDTYLVTTPFGRGISLPDGASFKEPTPSYITFHPTGRVEAGPIYLENAAGRSYKITLNSIGRITIEE